MRTWVQIPSCHMAWPHVQRNLIIVGPGDGRITGAQWPPSHHLRSVRDDAAGIVQSDRQDTQCPPLICMHTLAHTQVCTTQRHRTVKTIRSLRAGAQQSCRCSKKPTLKRSTKKTQLPQNQKRVKSDVKKALQAGNGKHNLEPHA